LFEEFDLLQIFDRDTSPQARRAVRFAAGVACRLGARSFVSGTEGVPDLAGLADLSDEPVETEPVIWAGDPSAERYRIILRATCPGSDRLVDSEITSVTVELEPWQTEDTLFAASGLARLLGDPEKAPLVPAANYAAHTIGYAAFSALTSVAATRLRFGRAEQAWLHGEASLTWINWKAAIAASLGEDLKRQGEQAEWPVVPCRDGYTAFVYNERDWERVIEMIGDPALRDDRFKSFKGRAEHRRAYMDSIKKWCAGQTKADLAKTLVEWEIPGAPVSTVTDLLTDPLLAHRDAITTTPSGYITLALPHRIEKETRGCAPRAEPDGPLPLSGLTVLDLGIITAGAGVSALLADMGATVIKIESDTYPDPFRAWAGATGGDSPLFKSNNRNKKGIALDLKTAEGLRSFLKLAETADIVVENFRRGVLDRLGLTFERLAEANPAILLASISGQGLSGPGAQHTTFGSTLEATSGFASLTCYEDGIPVISGRNLNYPDQTVCLYGAAIIAAQAIDCRRSGTARHIDISQRDCAIYQIGDMFDRPAETPRAKSATLNCADGEYIAVSHAGAIPAADFIAESTARMTAADCAKALLDKDIGAVVARSGKELLDAPAARAADTFMYSPNGALVKGFPFQLIQSPMRIHSNAPTVGEHTHSIIKLDGESSHAD
jgi:crotonobetainyl-CoA:carnitine CoA-transferase CaiB-like acyl-CoA transferase